MPTSNETFTTQKGIEIQSRDLANWERVLKPNYFILLRYAATKDNDYALNGYEITRGQQIDFIVGKLMRGEQLTF